LRLNRFTDDEEKTVQNLAIILIKCINMWQIYNFKEQ
jgi:hypothetical protein